MNESVALSKPIEPHARPGCQIVPPNLVVSHGEAHKGKLIHQTRNRPELEPLASEIDVLTPVCAGLDLVLAFALVTVIFYMTAAQAFEGVYMELHFDIWLKAPNVRVAGRERDGLGSDERNGEAQILGGDLGR